MAKWGHRWQSKHQAFVSLLVSTYTTPLQQRYVVTACVGDGNQSVSPDDATRGLDASHRRRAVTTVPLKHLPETLSTRIQFTYVFHTELLCQHADLYRVHFPFLVQDFLQVT